MNKLHRGFVLYIVLVGHMHHRMDLHTESRNRHAQIHIRHRVGIHLWYISSKDLL